MVEWEAIFLVLISSVFTAAGMIGFKRGAHGSFSTIIRNKWTWIGLFLHLLSISIYLLALRQGELSVLYPFAATSYIWAALFSRYYLQEVINRWKWLSLFGIIVGVVLIGMGS